MKRCLHLHIIVCFIVSSASCEWIEIAQGTPAYPAHTYAIATNNNDRVEGVVRWDNQNYDLDLYIFKNNQPIFNPYYAVEVFE